MNISLIDVDGHNFPNLALMKISAYHKSKGDLVEWHDPLFSSPDLCYASKVFTFSPDYDYFPNCKVVKGGTGYNLQTILPVDIEKCCPDYSLYNINYSMGFLTRGCIRKCNECIVPEKEGKIKAHASIYDFVKHRDVVFLDNNVLASSHGINQIEQCIKNNLRVDFNQGLDARLIDKPIAKLLSRVKWLKPVRLACDSHSMKLPVAKAVRYLRQQNVTPKQYFCYLLVKEIEDAHDRAEFLKRIKVDPFAQPYRDKKGTKPTDEQKRFARWVNHKAIFKSVKWKDYKS